MSFEQYQFLRYYLPGSLFLLELGLFLAPFINYFELQKLLGGNLLSLVTVVGGAFVVSPAIGYLLYSAYDTAIYNQKAMNWDNRRSLMYLIEWARHPRMSARNLERIFVGIDQADSNTLKIMKKDLNSVDFGKLRPSLKSLIDFIIHSKPRNGNSEVRDDEISANLRGYWSHFGARWVCGAIAPITALGTFFILLVFLFPILIQGPIVFQHWATPYERWIWLAIDTVPISLFSGILLYSRNNPRMEAFELEYYIIRTKIRASHERFYEKTRSYFRRRINEP
jgi:hypothetical protein